MIFGSLFAGIGGIDLGLERAGMRCAWQVEIDDYATRVLAKHWPNVHRERDVRTCGAANLAPVDLICGGFPCQDISYAGRGEGLGGARSGLWYEYARIVRELRPRYVLVENVSALLTRGLDAVLGTLAALGYDAEWHCIPAAYVGAPHIRDRVFVVAYSDRGGCTRSGLCQEQQRRAEVISTSAPRQRCTMADADSVNGRAGTQQSSRQRIWDRHKAINGGWWATEPDVGRVADGIPARMDRLRGLGRQIVAFDRAVRR
jgi:DNA (cytosine-5)-methyltransferase 1